MVEADHTNDAVLSTPNRETETAVCLGPLCIETLLGIHTHTLTSHSHNFIIHIKVTVMATYYTSSKKD